MELNGSQFDQFLETIVEEIEHFTGQFTKTYFPGSSPSPQEATTDCRCHYECNGHNDNHNNGGS